MSKILFERACAVMPGGVNSPVRAFNAVGGDPSYWRSGQGAYLMDHEHRLVLDYVGGFGPMILGHAHPEVTEALRAQAGLGTVFGGNHVAEIELAELIAQLMPSLEKIRLMNSGTEAVMTAIRLAKAVTGRSSVIKFSGHYHGHVDELLEEAGSGVASFHANDASKNQGNHVYHAQFNDLTSVEACFVRAQGSIAAVIIEPVAGNMGCVLPESGFLQAVQALCRREGALFILDEVMTGFRVALGGAQSVYQCQPDLTVLGKIVGGGLPVGALGGRRALMDELSPNGPVYQAGTFSGNPMTVTAGLTCLQILSKQAETLYADLAGYNQDLALGLKSCAHRHHIDLQVQSLGGMFGLAFSKQPVKDYVSVKQADVKRFNAFFHGMLAQGVMIPPSPYEAWFNSICHREDELKLTLEAANTVFSCMQIQKESVGLES